MKCLTSIFRENYIFFCKVLFGIADFGKYWFYILLVKENYHKFTVGLVKLSTGGTSIKHQYSLHILLGKKLYSINIKWIWRNLFIKIILLLLVNSCVKKNKSKKCINVFHYCIYYCLYLLLHSLTALREATARYPKPLQKVTIMNLCYQKAKQGDLCAYHGWRGDWGQNRFRKNLSRVSQGEQEMKKVKASHNTSLVNLHQCFCSSLTKYKKQSNRITESAACNTFMS